MHTEQAGKDVRWFAVATRSRQEKAAQLELEERGFEVFLPTKRVRRAWSDRVQNLELALFPGYLFIHELMSAQRRVDLLKARGVFDLVGRLPGDDRIARSIPPWQIESLRALVQSDREIDPVARLIPGTWVQVAAGPLKGAQGVVERSADGKQRLRVQVDLLGRGVSCALCVDDVIEHPMREAS